jgi:hypothetical protein
VDTTLKKRTNNSVDEWIDRFVECVNQSEREPKSVEDIPPRLRMALAGVGQWTQPMEYFDWQIRKADRSEWIETLEAKLPFPFPPSFRSLVRRYVYPDFTIGTLWLFANTGEPLFHEMCDAIVRDKHLSQVLVRHGYLQFARPNTGDYDPICFDTRRRLKGGEYPIVRVAHEPILCHDRIGDVGEIAPSFLAFGINVVQTVDAAAGL